MTHPDHKERVRDQFGASAEAYVQSATHAGGKDLARLVELSCVTPDCRVLDVATGGGHTALAFAPHAHSVVASDLTERMLDKASEFIASKGYSNVQYAVADAEALPFANESFDIVTCRIAPHHFGDMGQAVLEFARVLRPGGRLLVIDNIAAEEPELDAFINTVEKIRDRTHVRSYTVSEWHDAVRRAGLEPVHTETFIKVHDYQDWITRSRLAPDAEVQLCEAFRTAPPRARQYYNVVMDTETVVSFSDYKILLLARHNSGV